MTGSVRALGVAVGLSLAVAAHAQAPEAPSMSADELRAVYAELAQTHDGFVYTVHTLRFSSDEIARKAWEQLQQPRFRMQRFDKLYKNVTPRTAFLFTFDPPLRERLVTLYEGGRTGPVLTRQGWVIVELVGTKPAPMPGLADMEKDIPGLVAAGAVPSAERLQNDPALKRRTAANLIQSVDDLRTAPADLDVNTRLSTGETLLLRALLRDRFDLAEALLKRGANPNACARKFCPVELAIHRGSRSAVELLLKSGADPNQRDPAIGVLEGPLGAAAYRGDLELANRLLAAGAQVNGQGGVEPPLAAAASAGQRAMVELLLAKGADLFALSKTGRTALDAAARARNAEFAEWLRGTMRAKAGESGRFAWDGWIEQDGKRFALDGRPIALKRAPFSIVVRMKPDAVVYATAATEAALYDEFRTQGPDGAFHFNGAISFHGKEPNDLVVHEPGKPGERWGGSQAWGKFPDFSAFGSIKDTPQGREHVRVIRELIVLGADDKRAEMHVVGYTGKSLFLVLGTRVRMTFMDDEVFAPRNVELRFGPS